MLKNFFCPHLRTFLSLLLEREEGKEEGRERNIDGREKHRLVASCTHMDQGSKLQPRCVPRLGINPATFQLRDDAPNN